VTAGTERAPWTVLILPYIEQDNLYRSFDQNSRFLSRFNQTGVNRDKQFSPTPSFYLCPANPKSNSGRVHTDYVGVCGGGAPSVPPADAEGSTGRVYFSNGILFVNSKIRITAIKDGTSNTYLIGETRYMRVPSDPGVGTNYPSWASGVDAQNNVLNSSYQTLVAAVRPVNAPMLDVTDSQYFMTIFSSAHSGGCNMGMADGSVHFVPDSLDLNIHRTLATRADGLPLGGLPQ
jgi:prepilin-type processing-associated H-X9-DG protein